MPGYFRVYRDTQNPKDIHFEQLPLVNNEKIPDEQLDLRDQVDKSLTVIRMLFEKDEALFEQHFRSLLMLSQLGLVGDSANPVLAMRVLNTLQEEIVSSQGGRIKNGYMLHLGKYSCLLGFPVLLLGIVLHLWCSLNSEIKSFMFLWVGCMAGVWLSFGARKIVLSFSDLHILEKDRLNPIIRLIFAGLLTIVIGLFLSTGGLVMEMGTLSTKSFSSSPQVALLIGLLCGLSEQALSMKVSQRAKQLLMLQ